MSASRGEQPRADIRGRALASLQHPGLRIAIGKPSLRPTPDGATNSPVQTEPPVNVSMMRGSEFSRLPTLTVAGSRTSSLADTMGMRGWSLRVPPAKT